MVRVTNRKYLFLGPGLVLVLALASFAAAPVAAGDSVARLIARTEAIAGKIDAAALRHACGGEVRCAARRIAETLGQGARLERVSSPTADTIRWVETLPSLGAVQTLPDGRRLIALNRFGRKAGQDLTRALKEGGTDVVLDLRANAGGDFGRMLRVAGLLIGPRHGALTLNQGNVSESLDLPRVTPGARPRRFAVLVGPGTASSAEVLAALLRRHAGAKILGARTAGKDYLLRVIAVEQNWRLLVPAERISVPGEILAGGLLPDAPVSPGLLAALSP